MCVLLWVLCVCVCVYICRWVLSAFGGQKSTDPVRLAHQQNPWILATLPPQLWDHRVHPAFDACGWSELRSTGLRGRHFTDEPFPQPQYTCPHGQSVWLYLKEVRNLSWIWEPAVVVLSHTFNPSTLEADRRIPKFKGSLVYRTTRKEINKETLPQKTKENIKVNLRHSRPSQGNLTT